jgi:hypothetical protein
MARPTKYKSKIAEAIFSFFRADTYTVAEVCRMVKISTSTFYSWRTNYSEFLEGLKEAEKDRNEIVVTEANKSLLKKIKGYTVQEKHTTTIGSGKFDTNGKEIPKIKECKIIERHIKPETTAIIFTLTNADPENWKNRQNSELTGKNGKDLMPAMDLSQLSDEELDRLLELKQKATTSIK